MFSIVYVKRRKSVGTKISPYGTILSDLVFECVTGFSSGMAQDSVDPEFGELTGLFKDIQVCTYMHFVLGGQ
jgi:hypothetical protein